MEFGAATATLPKKVPSGYGVAGRSPYDGVFAAPVKLRAPSFTSRFEDYREIFSGGASAGTGGGVGGGSLGSSIPILELPELNSDRSKTDEVRGSKLDYEAVFGGFRSLDSAVRFEELVAAETTKKGSSSNGTSTRSKAIGGQRSCRDNNNYPKETCVVSPPSNDAKIINMSYHKVNQGSESGTNGTTHIAQLHAVPAYTCLVEEISPVKMNRAYKSVPAVQAAYSGDEYNEGIGEGRHTKSFAGPSPDVAKTQSSSNVEKIKNRSDCFAGSSSDIAKTRSSNNGGKIKNRSVSFSGPSPDIAKTQSSNNGGKIKNRSDSFDAFSDPCGTKNGSNGTHQVKVPLSDTIAGDWDNINGNAMASMASKCQTSKSDTSEGAAYPDSPSYLDDMVDSNSEAAASVAALRKAIEEAQLRLKVAKESMRRKKEGFPDRVKRKSNIDVKDEMKKEAKVAYKTMKLEARETSRDTNALPEISSEVGRPMMKEQVRSVLGAKEMSVAKESVQDAHNKLQSTQAEYQEEVKHTDVDHNAYVHHLEEVENNKKVSYVRNEGWTSDEKQEESDHTIEAVMEYWEQKDKEEKGHVGNEAGACADLANETKHRCKEEVCAGDEASANIKKLDETKNRREEVVDETELVEGTPDSGKTEVRLKENEDGTADKCTLFHEPEDGGRKVERSHELQEGKRISTSTQELIEVEKNIPEEKKGMEENVEVSNDLEECELTEFLEPIDNEVACIPHDSHLVSVEGERQNIGDLEDIKKMNGAGFLDENRGTEHPCQVEDTGNMFGNVYVQKILEETADHIHGEGEIYERATNDSELDDNERFHDVEASENELEGGILLMDENKKGMEDNKEPVEAVRVIEADPDYKEIIADEAGKTTETSSKYEPGEVEKMSKIHVADTVIENEEAVKVTPEVYAHDAQDVIMLSSDACQHGDNYEEPKSVRETSDSLRHKDKCEEPESFPETSDSLRHEDKCEEPESVPETSGSFQHEYKYEEPEPVQETSDSLQNEDNYEEPESFQDRSGFLEKHAVDTSAFNLGALGLKDAACQMQTTSATIPSEDAATNTGETDMMVRGNEDQCLENTDNDCSSAVPVEETTAEPVKVNDAKDARVELNEEIEENQSNSSEENLFDNEHNIEVFQMPGMSECKSRLFKEEEAKTIPSSVKQNHQASMTMVEEESKSNDNSQEAEHQQEHLKRIDEAKERERERKREREKEKLAVERAIREARERAFADARERAALERAASGARQKNVDGRERQGKTVGQTSEKTLAEKAAMEAKLKVERAAVERATAEARARALERALSEKAASDARNKFDKSDKNFHSKTFSYGVRDSIDVFGGANGDSAQRCKARSERHQRIGERVAKALAEKNMRDRIVQKEQEEKNRIAEALDADIKRWSSGKAGNLRALLSTLQYILGPDSGWQPIPLTDIISATAVKKAYRKATLSVHPDKLQQRGASIQQKYICEKVFDLLKEAWNRFNMEER